MLASSIPYAAKPPAATPVVVEQIIAQCQQRMAELNEIANQIEIQQASLARDINGVIAEREALERILYAATNPPPPPIGGATLPVGGWVSQGAVVG